MEGVSAGLIAAMVERWDQVRQPMDAELTTQSAAFRSGMRVVVLQMLTSGEDAAAVELPLWKHGFYRFIEAYRRMPKETMPDGVHGAPHGMAFRATLDHAAGFYLQLLADVQAQHRIELNRPGGPPHALATVQRCLQFLGDVARYVETYQAPLLARRPCFTVARTYYRQAVAAGPGLGAPYNQLAVIAAAEHQVAMAAYYYVRSCGAMQPFPTAPTNLAMLLRKLPPAVPGEVMLLQAVRLLTDTPSSEAFAANLQAWLATAAATLERTLQVVVVVFYAAQRANDYSLLLDVLDTLVQAANVLEDTHLLASPALAGTKICLEWCLSYVQPTSWSEQQRASVTALGRSLIPFSLQPTDTAMPQFTALPEDAEVLGFAAAQLVGSQNTHSAAIGAARATAVLALIQRVVGSLSVSVLHEQQMDTSSDDVEEDDVDEVIVYRGRAVPNGSQISNPGVASVSAVAQAMVAAELSLRPSLAPTKIVGTPMAGTPGTKPPLSTRMWTSPFNGAHDFLSDYGQPAPWGQTPNCVTQSSWMAFMPDPAQSSAWTPWQPPAEDIASFCVSRPHEQGTRLAP